MVHRRYQNRSQDGTWDRVLAELQASGDAEQPLVVACRYTRTC
jgi:hypothetical protein